MKPSIFFVTLIMLVVAQISGDAQNQPKEKTTSLKGSDRVTGQGSVCRADLHQRLCREKRQRKPQRLRHSLQEHFRRLITTQQRRTS